jgi:hypothetical protein
VDPCERLGIAITGRILGLWQPALRRTSVFWRALRDSGFLFSSPRSQWNKSQALRITFLLYCFVGTAVVSVSFLFLLFKKVTNAQR